MRVVDQQEGISLNEAWEIIHFHTNTSGQASDMQEEQHDFPRGVSRPALRALAGAGYTRLDQLTGVTEAELLKLHGMGPKALRILREALHGRGQSFAEPG